MYFEISKMEPMPFLSDGANELFTKRMLWAKPTKKFISELPPQLRNLNIKPFVVHKIIGEHFLDSIYNFEIRSDDVFVCSLPKCGSTWLETIVTLLMHNLDYKTIQSAKLSQLMADFENFQNFPSIASELLKNDRSNTLTEKQAYEIAWNQHYDSLESPRIIKTHIPAYALPKAIWSKGTKIVYITRNLKDMVVSDYHFRRNFCPSDIQMDDVVNGIINDTWVTSPRFDHVLNFWDIRHLPNVCFITYEDLVRKPFETIKKISEFLGHNYNDQQLNGLLEFISFDNMKKNPAINRENGLAAMEKLTGKQRLDASYT